MALATARAQIKDSEEVTDKMHGCNIDIEATLSESWVCPRVPVSFSAPHQVPEYPYSLSWGRDEYQEVTNRGSWQQKIEFVKVG